MTFWPNYSRTTYLSSRVNIYISENRKKWNIASFNLVCTYTNTCICFLNNYTATIYLWILISTEEMTKCVSVSGSMFDPVKVTACDNYTVNSNAMTLALYRFIWENYGNFWNCVFCVSIWTCDSITGPDSII